MKFSQNFRLARFTFLFLIFAQTPCLRLSKNYFHPPLRLPFIFITKCLFVRKGKLRRVCSLLLFTAFLFPSPPSSLHHQDCSEKLKVLKSYLDLACFSSETGIKQIDMIFYFVHSSNSLAALFREGCGVWVVGLHRKNIFLQDFLCWLLAKQIGTRSTCRDWINNPYSNRKRACQDELPITSTQWSSVRLLARLPIVKSQNNQNVACNSFN